MTAPVTLAGRLFARFRRDRRGVSAIEFAFIAPVLLLFLGGAWELNRILEVRAFVSQYNGNMASVLAQCPRDTSVDCLAEAGRMIQAMNHARPQYDPALFYASVAFVRVQSGGLVYHTRYNQSHWRRSGQYLVSTAAPSAWNHLIASYNLQEGDNAIYIVLGYNYQPAIFTFLRSSTEALGNCGWTMSAGAAAGSGFNCFAMTNLVMWN